MDLKDLKSIKPEVKWTHDDKNEGNWAAYARLLLYMWLIIKTYGYDLNFSSNKN